MPIKMYTRNAKKHDRRRKSLCCSLDIRYNLIFRTDSETVMMLIGASGWGCTRRVALASASLISWKAVVAISVHFSSRLLGAVDLSIELSGVMIVAQRGMNQ